MCADSNQRPVTGFKAIRGGWGNKKFGDLRTYVKPAPPHAPIFQRIVPSLEGQLKWATQKSGMASDDFPMRRSSFLKAG